MTDDEYGELDEASIFRALADHDVQFVVVGGGAALLWGAQRGTRDIDCVARQSTENYQRLCAALIQMGRPRLRIEGVDDETAAELSKQLLHPDFFTRTAASTWRTDAGSLDVLAAIPDLDGVDVGYAQLHERATRVSAGEFRVPIASLDDIIVDSVVKRTMSSSERLGLSAAHVLTRVIGVRSWNRVRSSSGAVKHR